MRSWPVVTIPTASDLVHPDPVEGISISRSVCNFGTSRGLETLRRQFLQFELIGRSAGQPTTKYAMRTALSGHGRIAVTGQVNLY